MTNTIRSYSNVSGQLESSRSPAPWWAQRLFWLARGLVLLVAIVAGGWWTEGGLTRVVSDGYGWYFQFAIVPIALIAGASVGVARWFFEHHRNGRAMAFSGWVVLTLALLHAAFCRFAWRADLLFGTALIFALAVQLTVRGETPGAVQHS